MQQTLILYPLFIMALLTFGAAVWLLRCRFRAVREGLNPAYFRLNHGAKLPAFLVQATQHYDNLFEMPLLFYVVVILTYVAQLADGAMTGLAWAYVGTRLVHTGIHLGSNHVRQRMRAFLLSCALLILMWVWLLIKLLTT